MLSRELGVLIPQINIAHSANLMYIFCMESTEAQDELDELIEEAIVDAYDEFEQRAGFYVLLGDNLGSPLPGQGNWRKGGSDWA
jgi:hypothetical protein